MHPKRVAENAFRMLLNKHSLPRRGDVMPPFVQIDGAESADRERVAINALAPGHEMRGEVNTLDLVADATLVIDSYLALLEAVAEAWEAHSRGSGRFLCWCRSCKGERKRAVSWLRAMKASPPTTERARALSAVGRQGA